VETTIHELTRKEVRDPTGGTRLADLSYWVGISQRRHTLRRINFGSNVAIFLLFFGLAMLEAFQDRNWIKASLWLAIGLVFLVADNLRGAREQKFR
jgi:hypothetical protein